MNADEKLAGILRAEADQVQPGPEGWDRIRSGIDARRRRTAWRRGGLATAAALSLVAVAVVVRPGGDGRQSQDVTNTPSPAPGVPTHLAAVWPFTSSAQLDAWRQDRSADAAWLKSPEAVAQRFARDYLHIVNSSVQPEAGNRVKVLRTIEGTTQEQLVTTVTLGQFGEAWLVTKAEAEAMRFDPVGPLVSPLTVRGTYQSADVRFTVELRGEPDAAGNAPVVAKAVAETSPPNVWTATLTFGELAGEGGSLVVTEGSLADSGLAAAAAIPLDFTTAPEPPASPSAEPSRTTGSMPDVFVGIEDGRVAVFRSNTGKLVRYLTEERPGGGVTEVRLAGSTAVYLQGAGTCTSVPGAVRLDGTPVTLDLPDETEPITGLDYDPERGSYAYFVVPCDGGAGDLVFGNREGSQRRRPAVPPRSALLLHSRWVIYVGTDGQLHGIPTVVGEPTTTGTPEAGCSYTAVTAQVADGLLTAAEQCPAGSRLVVLDQRLGRVDVLKDLDQIAVQRLDYDETDRYLLIWRAGASVTGPIEALILATELRPIAQGPQSPSW